MYSEGIEDESLIALVKEYPSIYDLDDSKYKDIKYKDRIWRAIGKELNTAVSECKHRWNALRDQYKRKVNRRKLDKGPNKNWRYERQMNFLIPFLRDRKPTGTETGSDCDDTKDSSPKTSETIIDTNPFMEIETSGSSLTAIKRRKLQHPVTRNEIETPTEPLPSVSLLSTEFSNKTDYPMMRDPTDILFETIAEKVKRFSPYYKNMAETKIFALVQQLELEQILQKTTSQQQQQQREQNPISQNYINIKTRCSTPPNLGDSLYLEVKDDVL